MRQAYYEELEAISDLLVDMTRLAEDAVTHATTALLDADLPLAESVIDGDKAVNALRASVEHRIFDVMARQQPVAGDLRRLTAGLRMASDIERAGDLATNIAKLARLRYPTSAVPPELRAQVLEMGEVAAQIVAKAGELVAKPDSERASQLDKDDDVMDDLQRRLFAAMLAPDWKHGVDTAVDLALAGRYFERFADHAVSVARQVAFLADGSAAVDPA